MEYKTILLEKKDGIAFLTINRPKVLNALNAEVLKELDHALDTLAADETLRGLILSGAGEKSFVAGADITEFQGLSVEQARALSIRGQGILRKVEELKVNSIAVINGFALGGGLELAMSCTFRYGTPAAKVGQPEVKLGLIPGYGGTQRLTRLVGHSKALEMCMTGRMVKADEAFKTGILDRVIEEGDPVEEAVNALNAMNENSPLANYYCRKAIMDGKELGFDEACRLESSLFGLCFATEDVKEGVSAFIEKRKAEFKGC